MKITIKISICFLIASTFLSYSLFSQNHKIPLKTLIDSLGNSFIKDKRSVGLSIGVYNEGKSNFYNYGTTIKNTNSHPSNNTVYEIGSITKAFVSLILAHAVIEKKVNLDDDVRKYLDGAYPNLEFNKKPITLLQLSNTTSGLPNWLPLFTKEITNAPSDSVPFLIERTYEKYTKKDFYKALHEVKLDTVPGYKSRHSNGAALLLSLILEKVFNAPIEDLVSKYITKPAQMNNTSFFASTSKSKLLSKGYSQSGMLMPYFNNKLLKGVGELNSSTADLLKFVKMQLDSKDRAIIFSHNKTFNAGWCDIGLTWLIYKHDSGVHQIWADGGTYGFCSYLIFYPEVNSGIVILANESDPTTSNRISDIADGIFNVLYKK